jgi:uncharacterized membrane protein
MSLIETMRSLRLIRSKEEIEKLNDKLAFDQCKKCNQTFPMSDLGYIKGFDGLICKRCRRSDLMLVMAIGIGISVVLGIILLLSANR